MAYSSRPYFDWVTTGNGNSPELCLIKSLVCSIGPIVVHGRTETIDDPALAGNTGTHNLICVMAPLSSPADVMLTIGFGIRRLRCTMVALHSVMCANGLIPRASAGVQSCATASKEDHGGPAGGNMGADSGPLGVIALPRLRFFINNQPMLPSSTIFEAIKNALQDAASEKAATLGQGQVNGLDARQLQAIWDGPHTITYCRFVNSHPWI
jgi:hypothetical protein